MSRLRVSHVIVQPVLVIDNGEELSPGPQAQPVSVPLSALDGLADLIRAEIAQMQEQMDGAGDPSATETENDHADEG